MPYRCQICKDCSDVEDVYQSDRDYPSDISDSDTEYYRRRWRRKYHRRTYQHGQGSERTKYSRNTSERDERREYGTKRGGRHNGGTYRRRDSSNEGREINNDQYRSEGDNERSNSRERYIDASKGGNEINTRSDFINRRRGFEERGRPRSIDHNNNERRDYSKNDNERNKHSNIDNTVDNKTEESNNDFVENNEKKQENRNTEENKQETEIESDHTSDSDNVWECLSHMGTETGTDSDSDKNYDEDMDAAQSTGREKRYANYHSRESHGGHSKGQAKSRRKRSLNVTFVKMPSGKKHPIITPKPKEFKCGTPTKRITLRKDGKMSGKEYQLVEKEMQNSIVDHANCISGGGCFNKFEIVKIEKLINGCLWKRYRHCQQDIITEHGYANQRMLFHGSAKADDIIETGFDERYADLNGMFGAGLYFAKHSSKANQYAFGYMGGKGCPAHADKNCHLCERKLLLCRVLLGKSKNLFTGQNLPHPPASYNSVVGVPSKQKGGLKYHEYIIYRGEQVYPEYMITYKIKD